MSEAEVELQLAAFCRAHTGDAAAEVRDLEPMPGHSGFSWGFSLLHGSPRRREPLVLRLAPPGVRPKGPADIVRQARLIRRLGSTPVPVPAVRWFGDDPRWFQRPFSIVQRLDGRPLHSPDTTAERGNELQAMTRQAIHALVQLHRIEWRPYTELLGDTQPPSAEIDRWERFRERVDNEQLALGADVGRLLHETAPTEARLGLCHGDFQWSNVFYSGDRLIAVLDWELAAVGAVLSDLAWLVVFSDPPAWGVESPALPPVAPPDRLVAMYEEAGGEVGDDFGWYRALAAYKWAVIIGFNFMLHRSGKRPDPLYDRLLSTMPRMLERALELLEVAR